MNYYLESGTAPEGCTRFLFSAEMQDLDYAHKLPYTNPLSCYKFVLIFVLPVDFTPRKDGVFTPVCKGYCLYLGKAAASIYLWLTCKSQVTFPTQSSSVSLGIGNSVLTGRDNAQLCLL